jgi:mannose/fructose/N-acetylgalactosamine-specific phosphotransferase system component IIC
VECKAPEVSITQQSFDQIIRYNMVLNVRWLLVTNSVQVVVAFVQQGNVQFVKEIPNWTQL